MTCDASWWIVQKSLSETLAPSPIKVLLESLLHIRRFDEIFFFLKIVFHNLNDYISFKTLHIPEPLRKWFKSFKKSWKNIFLLFIILKLDSTDTFFSKPITVQRPSKICWDPFCSWIFDKTELHQFDHMRNDSLTEMTTLCMLLSYKDQIRIRIIWEKLYLWNILMNVKCEGEGY